MASYLRPQSVQKGSELTVWNRLYKIALEHARHHLASSDPRRRILERGSNDPEALLRSLSIICEADIHREFSS